MGLADPAHRAAVLENIVADIDAKGLTAGDVGFRYLLRALADGNRSDVIYKMNNQSTTPGYGMMLAKGATALTEAWDANPRSSHNHFMLGQISEWFFYDLAGIQSDPESWIPEGFVETYHRGRPVMGEGQLCLGARENRQRVDTHGGRDHRHDGDSCEYHSQSISSHRSTQILRAA